MDWVSELKHYQGSMSDDDLLDEAIATCENFFNTMCKDEKFKDGLLHRSRPLAIAYLVLKHIKEQTKSPQH